MSNVDMNRSYLMRLHPKSNEDIPVVSIDLTQLSVTEQLLPSPSKCLLATTILLLSDISSNDILQWCKWAEHYPSLGKL